MYHLLQVYTYSLDIIIIIDRIKEILNFMLVGVANAPGVDIEERKVTVMFAAGETMKLESIEILPDNEEEGDEYFNVNLVQQPGILLGSPSSEFLIIEDDSESPHTHTHTHTHKHAHIYCDVN